MNLLTRKIMRNKIKKMKGLQNETSNNSTMSKKVKQFIDGLGCEVNVEDKE